MNPLRLVIIGTNWGFPNGAGAAARIGSYCIGLRNLGARVHVLCVSPTERGDACMNHDARGIYAGAAYEYACGRTLVPASPVGRKWLKLVGYWGILRALRAINREGKIDGILYYNPIDPFCTRFLHAMTRRLGTPLVGEMTESPEVVCTRTRSERAQKWLNEHGGYKLFDGFVVISDHLRSYFGTRLRPTAPILQVPILVDTSPYRRGGTEGPPPHLLVYCGTLTYRPEIESVLEIFARVANAFPSWRLRVIGNTADACYLGELKALTVRLGIDGRVEFTGALPRDQIPAALMDAGVLILPRAADLRSTAGFPTKLGEYLATGRPVVTTAVGDITKYLRDGENAFLVDSGDPEAFAARVRFVLSHPETAREVARQGRRTAEQEFECRVQGRRLATFISSLSVHPRTSHQLVGEARS